MKGEKRWKTAPLEDLLEAEWGRRDCDYDINGEPVVWDSCPACWEPRSRGHAKGCELRARIEALSTEVTK